MHNTIEQIFHYIWPFRFDVSKRLQGSSTKMGQEESYNRLEGPGEKDLAGLEMRSKRRGGGR